MSFDRKDPTSALGWNSTAVSGFLLHSHFDWRIPEEMRQEFLESKQLVHITCRSEAPFGATCGGSSGNMDPLVDSLLEASAKVFYSEYSASFIQPLQHSTKFMSWIEQQIMPKQNSGSKFTYMLV